MTAKLSSSVSAVCRPVTISWTVVIHITISPLVHLSAPYRKQFHHQERVSVVWYFPNCKYRNFKGGVSST